MLQPATEVDNSELNPIWIMTIILWKGGLGKKILHRHPEIAVFCDSINQAAIYLYYIPHNPDFFGIGGMAPCPPLATLLYTYTLNK